MRQVLTTISTAAVCALALLGGASAAPVDLTTMALNGSAQLSGSNIQLATGNGAAGSAWTPGSFALAPTTNFEAAFTYIGSGLGDGMTFTIQNSSTSALGGGGSGLGYDIETSVGHFANAIPNSVAVGIDYFFNFIWLTPDNSVLGLNGTGLLGAGHLGLSLATGSPIDVVVDYDSTTHTLTAYLDGLLWLTFVDDLFADVGSTAYFGFTAATGDASATTVVTSFDLTLTDATQATPLPTALPLFAGGLGVLGLLARRRQRTVAA